MVDNNKTHVRLQLTDTESEFVSLVAQGYTHADAYAKAYNLTDLVMIGKRLPSLLRRPGVKRAIDSMHDADPLVDLAAADREMLRICLRTARSSITSDKDRLDAVKTYASIRSKLSVGGQDCAQPVTAGTLTGALDDIRKDRFTDAYRTPGMGVVDDA